MPPTPTLIMEGRRKGRPNERASEPDESGAALPKVEADQRGVALRQSDGRTGGAGLDWEAGANLNSARRRRAHNQAQCHN